MAVNVDGSETNMREKEVKRDRRMHCTGAERGGHVAESQFLFKIVI